MTSREMTHIMPAAGPEAVVPEKRSPTDVATLMKRPFAPHVIKSRKIAGRDTQCVAIGDVVARLNKACLEWSWHVSSIEIHTMPIRRKGELLNMPVMNVIGTLWIPGLSSRQGVDTAPCENDNNAAIIAESDSVKRAASTFGVPGGQKRSTGRLALTCRLYSETHHHDHHTITAIAAGPIA